MTDYEFSTEMTMDGIEWDHLADALGFATPAPFDVRVVSRVPQLRIRRRRSGWRSRFRIVTRETLLRNCRFESFDGRKITMEAST